MEDVILAMDPSITRVGLALFVEGKLVHTGYVKGQGTTKDDIMHRVVRTAKEVYKWSLESMCAGFVDTMVCEWPQIYQRADDKTKGDPNNLVPLAGVCGAVGALLYNDYGTQMVSFKPREWADNVPKIETVKGCKKSPRAYRTIACLTPEEMKVWVKVKYHDEIDAIGIGLHYLDRFRPRVMPGATEG